MITLLVTGKKVLLDEDVLMSLKRFNHPSRVKRKHLIPLCIVGQNYVKWAGTFEGKQRSISLHHMVLGKPLNNLEIDHINRNPLDNRRCNLRIVTKRENHHNTRRNNKLVGVSKNKKTGKFESYIQIEGNRYHLGLFKCPEMAKAAYVLIRELYERSTLGGSKGGQ